jgi:hypothetical protein
MKVSGDAFSPLHPLCVFVSLCLCVSVAIHHLAEAAIARGVIAPRSITAPLLVMV